MKSKPVVIVSIGVVFTALSAIFIRFSEAPPLVIATYRMGITSLLLTPLFLLELRRNRLSEDRPEPATDASVVALPRAIALSFVSGLFLAAHFATWITSLSHTSVAHATVLVTTHPIIVAVLGLLFLNERVTFPGAIWMAGAVGGGALLVSGGITGGEPTVFGNLLALGGAFTASIYIIIGRYARRYLSLNAYTMIVYWTAFAALLTGALASGQPMWPYPPREFLIFGALAVFCTLLGHSLFNWALKFLPTAAVSTTILGEPIIASALAVVLFGEIPSVVTLSGGAVILCSILLFHRSQRTRSKASSTDALPL